MSAQDTLFTLGEHLEVWKVQTGGHICVCYEHCEVKDGIFLKAIFGCGTTFSEACEDYLNQIHGQTLVFNACTNSRKEVRVL